MGHYYTTITKYYWCTYFTLHTIVPKRTHRTIRDKNLTTLGGRLYSYYCNRHGSVASDDKYASHELAAEIAQPSDRAQNEKDVLNARNIDDTLNAGW